MADAKLSETLVSRGGSASCRVDLWSDGIPLDQVIPLACGKVSRDSSVSRRRGISLSVTDGNPDRNVEFPPGPITRLAFPDAPDDVVGSAQRQVILGPAPLQVRCSQIDEEGRRWYLADGELNFPPTAFYKDAQLLEVGVEVETKVDNEAQSYTEVIFD